MRGCWGSLSTMMTARIYEFGASPERTQDAYGFLEAQVRFLLVLWDLVLNGQIEVLSAPALRELCWMAGVAPLPADKQALMLSLQDVWYAALQRPNALGHHEWREAVEHGDIAGAQIALRLLVADHMAEPSAAVPRLGVVVPMWMH